jgi:YgiT-type zinc finger domain-containing protein
MIQIPLESRCPLCGGTKKPGTTTYSVDLGFGVIVVRNVPAMVCDQCGEAWIDAERAKELERMTDDARERRRQVEVVTL